MPKVECWFKQDLKKPVKVQTLNGNVFTLDNVGSLIGVEVYDNGSPATLSGSVNGYIILPDDTTVSVAGTRSGNKVSINLPQSALAIPGFIKIAVKLTNSSEITTLLAVVATVYKSRTDTIITPSQQIITDWSQQIAAEMQAVEDASAAMDMNIDIKLGAFPLTSISFSGNTANNDPLVVTTGGYFTLRNFNSTYQLVQRAFSCNASYSISNGYALVCDVEAHQLSVQEMGTQVLDEKYIILLWKNSTQIKGAWSVFYIYDKIGNTTLPTTSQTLTGAIAEHETDLSNQQTQISNIKREIDVKIGVFPLTSISFSGNTSNTDPLVVTTGGYFTLRNFDSSVQNTQRGFSCDASYSINNGYALVCDVELHQLSVKEMGSQILDQKYVILLWKNSTQIKGEWNVFYYLSVIEPKIASNADYEKTSRPLFEVVPHSSLSFSGNNDNSDSLVFTTGGYFYEHNYDSSITTYYRARTCNASYTIANGSGLLYQISTHTLSVVSLGSEYVSDDYVLLLWKQATQIKGIWSVYYYNDLWNKKLGIISHNAYHRDSSTSGSFYYIFTPITLIEGKKYEITADGHGSDINIILTTAKTLNTSDRITLLGNLERYVITATAAQTAALYAGVYTKATSTGAIDLDIWVNELSSDDNKISANIEKDIDQIHRINKPIPTYFNSYLSGKIESINALMAESYNSDAYIFITDNHIAKNSLSSFPVMREILSKTAIDKVIYNGDAVYAYGADSEIADQANINLAGFKLLRPYAKVFMNRGNHDFTIKTSASASTGYTYGYPFVYEYLTKIAEQYAHVIPGKMYWYFDNPVQKIRYIGVDTTDTQTEGAYPLGNLVTFSQDQIDWLCETLNVSDGWSVIVTGHIPVLYGAATEQLRVLAAILKGYAGKTIAQASIGETSVNFDFSGYHGTLVCYMCGHTHEDHTTTSDGVLEICTRCDARFQDDGITMTLGTITEVSFDVVIINKDSEKVKTIRIGAGSNREISY